MAVVCNVLAGASARVIVCGTAMTLGLHPWLASAVGKIAVGERLEPAALGHHLRAWSQASASMYLKNFIVSTVAGSAEGVGDLDITDVPGLFPCALGL